MPDAALLAARTDQTKLCRSCAARFGGLACPSCGNTSVLDLSRGDHRRAAALWARERFPDRDVNPFGSSEATHTRAPKIALLVIAIALTVLAALFELWIVCGLAAAASVVLAVRLFDDDPVSRLARNKPSELANMQAIGVLPPALPAPSGERIARRGSVHSDRPLEAPLSGEPCVAFRLVGRVGDCLIDDASTAPFTLAPRDGPSVTVLSSACVLELPVHHVIAEPGAVRRVQRFLAERGIESADPIELAEGVIRIGDEVTVEGTLESVASGAGYRGSAHTEFLVGRSDSPVLLRPA